jgi:type IV pilus assembly protein PilM
MARTYLPIGIDFGARSIKAVQLAPHGAGWSVAAAAARPMPGDLTNDWTRAWLDLTPVVQEMLASAPFQGRRVFSSLPAAAVHYKNLRLPPMPPDDIAGAVEFEAADRLGLEETGCQVQFFNAGEVTQGDEKRQEIIVMAAPVPLVAEHVQMLLSCGLEPEVIDAAPSMMARCLTTDGRLDPEAPAQMIVDVGYSAAKVLIAQNGRVVFFKPIDIAGRQFDEAVAKKLSLSPKDAAERRRFKTAGDSRANDPEVADALGELMTELGREIGLCLRYFNVTFRGSRPAKGLLIGGEAHDATLVRQLSTTVGIGFEVMDPFEHMSCEGARKALQQGGHPAAWAPAVALARRAAPKAKRGAA